MEQRTFGELVQDLKQRREVGDLPPVVLLGAGASVASGLIVDPTGRRLSIAPIGAVDHLVAIESVVAPGASGAPVVDNTMAVRGFIVAGSTDRPPSFMYPAHRWADALQS